MRIKKLTAKGYGGRRTTTKAIVIHYTGNPKDSAKGNATYFHNNKVSAGAHFFVDAKDIYESTPRDHCSWSVGRLYNRQYAKYWGKLSNTNTINIEIACDAGGYKATQKAIDNALWLTKYLMKKYGIPASMVVRHKDVCGKDCPGFWWDDDKWKREFKTKLAATKKAPKHSYYKNVGQYKILKAPRVIRASYSPKAKIVGYIKDHSVYTITDTEHTNGIFYGKLKSGKGWICLRDDYVKKV